MAMLAHLRSLQALEMAVRKGSLKAAADDLGITQAAVGQRIKTLEDYLGFDLLVRGRSGIRATRELEGAVAHLGAAFRELETVADILDFQRVDEIHIVADSDWAELWLKPRLPEFKRDNPNILFCINGLGDVPIRIGQADCEVYFGSTNRCADAVRLFQDYLAPVSSPENTKRISKLPKRERLEGFPLLHLDCYKSDSTAIGWPEWIKRYGYRKTASERGIRYKHIVHALEAVYADAGLMVCGIGLVMEQLAAGRLSLPFAKSHGAWTEQAYCAHFTQASLRRIQIVRFREWLIVESRKTEQQLGSVLKRRK